MNWDYSFTEKARKESRKLVRYVQKEIIRYFDSRIAGKDDPHRFGKALRGDLAGTWRYLIGDYCVLCQIKETQLLVLVISVGHRKNVYD